MIMSRIVVLFVFLCVLWSCNDDDDVTAPAPDPPRALSEVLAEDEVKIQEYLKSHYYNYAEFQNPPEDFDYKIKLQVIPEGNMDTIALIDQVQSKTTNVSSGIEGGEVEVPHTYYYLVAREGAGEFPTIADSTFVTYVGTLLDDTRFDGIDNYTWQYLPFFLRGYAAGISNMKAGGEILTNVDGTYSITETGIGMVVMPSGLAYFNSSPSSIIPPYSPLVFTLDVGTIAENTDYDRDGVPSILEDVNNDGNVNNDNTDGDFISQGVPGFNHRDPDDDNDGTPTRDEIELDALGNFVSFRDSDGDGIWDHLDTDSK